MFIHVCVCVSTAFFAGFSAKPHATFCAFLWDAEISCIVEFGVVMWTVSYICLHHNINHVIYIIIRSLRSYWSITRLCHVLCCSLHLCVMVRSVLLWECGFHCECYVCNACAERNLNRFIVFLIICTNLCCVCSAQWWSFMPWGARLLTKSRGSFQVSQVCRAVCSWSYITQFLVTVILTYIYIHMWSYTSKHF
jgi:hypothetical protein